MKGDDIMSLDKSTYLECDECHTFSGTANQCVQDDEGNLYCPICENLLMDNSGLESYLTHLSKQFHPTGIVFQDYVDYLAHIQPLAYVFQPEFEVLSSNNELSFDTFDVTNSHQLSEVMHHKNTSLYMVSEKEATAKQIIAIMRLQEAVHHIKPEIKILGIEDVECLNRRQASRFIQILKAITWMNDGITSKQHQFVENIEEKVRNYFYFDDLLTKDDFDTIIDTKSKLEGHERISIYQRINQYLEPVILEPTEDFQNWMYDINETLIPYNEIKDDVIEWKQKQSKSSE